MITRIETKNIYGLKGEKSFPLTKVTFVIGKNGTGKTSLVRGFSSILTKETDDSFVTMGEANGKVKGLFDDGTTIEMEKGKSTSHYSCGKKITKKAAEEVVEKAEDVPTDAIKILLGENQSLLDMKPEAFGEIMASIVMRGLNANALYSEMKLTEEERKILSGIHVSPAINKEDVEKIYKSLSAMYTQKNKEHNTLLGEIGSLQSTPPTRKRELCMREIDAWNGFNAEALNYEAGVEKASASEKRLAAFGARLKEMQAVLKAKQAPRPDEATIEANKRKLKELEMEQVSLLKDIEVSEKSKHSFESILKNLNSNICPISQKLICMTDKTSVKEEIEENIKNLDDMLSSMKSKAEALSSRIKTITDVLEKLSKEQESYKAYSALLERYRNFEATKPAIVPKPAPVAHTIQECSEKLRKLSDELARMDMFEKGEKKKAELKKIGQETDLIYQLRCKFAPKGQAYNVIGKKVESLLDSYIADEASALNMNEKFKFEFDEGLVLYVERKGALIEARNLSCGERFMTQLLLLSVVNRLTQFKFGYAVIDNIDSLDSENLLKVVQFVSNKAFMDRFKNIILSGVDHTDIVNVLTSINDPGVSIINF